MKEACEIRGKMDLKMCDFLGPWKRGVAKRAFIDWVYVLSSRTIGPPLDDAPGMRGLWKS